MATTFCTHAAFISSLCCLCFVECKNLCIVRRVKFLKFSQFFTHFTCEQGCWVKSTNTNWTEEKFLGFCFKVFLGCILHTFLKRIEWEFSDVEWRGSKQKEEKMNLLNIRDFYMLNFIFLRLRESDSWGSVGEGINNKEKACKSRFSSFFPQALWFFTFGSLVDFCAYLFLLYTTHNKRLHKRIWMLKKIKFNNPEEFWQIFDVDKTWEKISLSTGMKKRSYWRV